MNRPYRALATAMLLLAAIPLAAQAGDVSLFATRDATLYEADPGVIANGSGEHIFTGSSSGGALFRCAVHFDIAGSIPYGANITFAALTLNVTRTVAGPESVALHALTADWGEGASNASGQEGGGAPAQSGDATWLHTFYSGMFWTNPGGDYVASPSTVTTVDQLDPFVWLGPGVVADVQNWLDNPAMNFGWILIGNESTTRTSKRFASLQNPNPDLRPRIRILFDFPVATEASTWSSLKQLY
jgi:hypothetical protein